MNVQVFWLRLTSLPFSYDPSRCPKCEVEREMISLTKVMACHDWSKSQIEQSESALGFPNRQRAKGKVGRDLKPGQRKANDRSEVPFLGRRVPDIEQPNWSK